MLGPVTGHYDLYCNCVNAVVIGSDLCRLVHGVVYLYGSVYFDISGDGRDTFCEKDHP